MKNWRAKNREKYNEYYRNRYATEPIFKEKRKIRALNKNEYKNKQVCEKCGNIENVERHHLDYNNPLIIIWLCKVCHNKEHTVCHTVDTV